MRLTAVAVLIVTGLGCGVPSRATDGQFTLQSTSGSFTDGTGSAALALLAVLRDGDGEGPSDVWNGEIEDGQGAKVGTFTYGDGSPTRWAAAWWPSVPLSRGDRLLVRMRNERGSVLEAPVAVSASGLDAPVPTLNATGGAVQWPAVPSAESYRCAFARP